MLSPRVSSGYCITWSMPSQVYKQYLTQSTWRAHRGMSIIDYVKFAGCYVKEGLLFPWRCVHLYVRRFDQGKQNTNKSLSFHVDIPLKS